jgi:hypothetical protein
MRGYSYKKTLVSYLSAVVAENVYEEIDVFL